MARLFCFQDNELLQGRLAYILLHHYHTMVHSPFPIFSRFTVSLSKYMLPTRTLASRQKNCRKSATIKSGANPPELSSSSIRAQDVVGSGTLLSINPLPLPPLLNNEC